MRTSSPVRQHRPAGESRGLRGAVLPTGGSFLVAARRSYADLFLKAASNPDLRDNVAYFYDVNAKLNVRLGRNGVLMLSTYGGRDRFSPAQPLRSAGEPFRHACVGTRSRQPPLLQGDAGRQRLRLSARLRRDGEAVIWTSRIRSLDLKVDEAWHLTDRNIIEFGVERTAHDSGPATSWQGQADTLVVHPRSHPARRGIPTALHLGQEVDLGPGSPFGTACATRLRSHGSGHHLPVRGGAP